MSEIARGARFSLFDNQLDAPEGEIMTLQFLDTKGANGFARREYIEGLPLTELWQELEAFCTRRDAQLRTEQGGTVEEHPESWGFEGWTRVYAWEIPGQRTRLHDTTKLQDVRYRWISVYPVTGSNEGHYIHVDLITQSDREEWRTPIFMTKTFAGHAAAVSLAGAVCRLLGV
jgi:hypothetical protein